MLVLPSPLNVISDILDELDIKEVNKDTRDNMISILDEHLEIVMERCYREGYDKGFLDGQYSMDKD